MREFAELKQKEARLACISFINGNLVYHFDVNGKYHLIERNLRDCQSIAEIFPTADFFEREIQEKEGIKITGASKERLFTEEKE